MAEIIALPDGHMTAITYLVVLPDQVLLIDPTTPVRHLPPNLPPIRRILATHGHIDHIYQADAWRRLSGAPLAIHDADRDCLTDPGRNLSALISNARTFAPAQETLAHGQVIDLDTAHQLTIWHTPGHTSGSSCFLLDEDGKPRALFSGDTLYFADPDDEHRLYAWSGSDQGDQCLCDLSLTRPFIVYANWLYYVDTKNQNRLMRLPLKGTRTDLDRSVLVIDDAVASFTVLPDAVYYRRPEDNTIYRVPLAGGSPQKVS